MNEEQGRLDDGELVNDQYEVLYLIGLGELGEVYDITDRHTSQDGVLKLFVPQVLDNPAAWQGYQEYCSQIRSYGHRTLVTPREFSIHPSTASPFAISAKVPVPALDQLVATVGNLLPAHFARLVKSLAPVLDGLHARGLVHRNLKPSNIFCALQDPNSVRLTDFEISALRAQVPPYPGWGATPGWVAPEAIDPKAVSTPAMDVYALALVGYFAMTGRLPYRQLEPFDPQAFSRELKEELPPASQRAQELGVRLDPKLDAWFAQALAPQPEARFHSVLEMADALLQLTVVTPPLVSEGRVLGEVATSEATNPALPSIPPSVSMPPLSTDPGVAAASVQPLVFNADLASRPAPPEAKPAAKPATAQAPPRARAQSAVKASFGGGLLLGALLGIVALVVVAAGLVLYLTRAGQPSEQAPGAEDPRTTTSASAMAEALDDAPETPSASTPPVPSTGQVEFRCKPKACTQAECDHDPVDASKPIELTPGQYVCLLSAEGYEQKVAIVTIQPGKTLRRDILLTEKEGPVETLPKPAEDTPKAAPKAKTTSTSKAATKKSSAGSTSTKKSAPKKRSTPKAKPKTKPCGTFIPCK